MRLSTLACEIIAILEALSIVTATYCSVSLKIALFSPERSLKLSDFLIISSYVFVIAQVLLNYDKHNFRSSNT